MGPFAMQYKEQRSEYILHSVLYSYNIMTNEDRTIFIYDTEEDALRVYKELWNICGNAPYVKFGDAGTFKLLGSQIIVRVPCGEPNPTLMAYEKKINHVLRFLKKEK